MTNPTAQRAAEVMEQIIDKFTANMSVGYRDNTTGGVHPVPVSFVIVEKIKPALTAAGIGLYDARTHVAVPREMLQKLGQHLPVMNELLAAHEESADD